MSIFTVSSQKVELKKQECIAKIRENLSQNGFSWVSSDTINSIFDCALRSLIIKGCAIKDEDIYIINIDKINSISIDVVSEIVLCAKVPSTAAHAALDAICALN